MNGTDDEDELDVGELFEKERQRELEAEAKHCGGLSPLGEMLVLCANPDLCDHDFAGWREFEDGNGGEQVCTKCGIGAMAYSLRTGI